MLCFLFPDDILELDVFRSWEFMSDAPVRSIVLPYVLYGPPLYLLKFVSGYMSETSYLRPYLLLVLPRLVALLYVTVTATPATRSVSPRENRPDRGRRSTHDSDDVKTSGDDVGSPFVVALVLVTGFFNRPTFVFFAAVPCLNWLLLGATTTLAILLKLSLTLLNAAAVATAFLIDDSLYYRTLTSANLSAFKTDSLSVSLVTFVKTLVVTPLNFIV